MITKVSRGARVGGLLGYLFGPGRHNEHVDARVVGCWDGDVLGRQPVVGRGGRLDVRGLSDALNVDLRHLGLCGGRGTVWHTVVALHPGDGVLDDWVWAQVAQEMVAAVGLEDDRRGAVRWVAVRHGLSVGGDDHIHVVAALAGVDDLGRTRPRTFVGGRGVNSEYALLRRAANECESRWGLTRTGAASGAGHRSPTRGERERAARAGLQVTSRESLAGLVRGAALRVGSAAELVEVLAGQGVVAQFSRPSQQRPGTFLGVTFHQRGHVNSRGEPVLFSGGKLGGDLSAPGLQRRWDANARVRGGVGGSPDAVAGFVDALTAAVTAANTSGTNANTASGAATAGAVGGGVVDVGVVHAQVRVAADGLWLLAGLVESDPVGPWHDSAGWAVRVAREPGACPDPGDGLDALVGAVAQLGMVPQGQTREERAWARAYLLFHRLLRAWARLESDPGRRQLLRDTAVRIEANTLRATRRGGVGPVTASAGVPVGGPVVVPVAAPVVATPGRPPVPGSVPVAGSVVAGSVVAGDSPVGKRA